MHPHSLLLLIPGILLLLLGRKLFWLTVALIGFVFGAELAATFLQHQSQWVTLAVEVGVGLIGALLAIFVQEIAIGIAGFLLGGEFCLMLSHSLAFYSASNWWVVFLVGGIVGAILMVSFFDWALVILSSLAGAHLIMDALKVTLAVKMAGFFVLAIIGILFQFALLGKRKAAVE